MHFQNFLSDLKQALSQGKDIKEIHSAWKDAIMSEIDKALFIDGLGPEDDLTSMAMYRLFQRYYAERGKEGFENILKLWGYLMEKEEGKKVNKYHFFKISCYILPIF